MRLTLSQIEERMQRFEHTCREGGFSVTSQRVALYRALLESDEHPSPELLFDTVRNDIASLSLATVYKALDTFKELGLVREVSPLHDRKRLDANLDPHHHLICLRCKRIVDLVDARLDALELSSERRGGFKLFDHTVQFHGLCPSCQKPD